MYSRGATLIEFMIALSIGLLLVMAMLQAYLSLQGKIILANNVRQIEEAALNSVNAISQEIERAGYIGCARLSAHFPIYHSSSYRLSNENKLMFTKDMLISRHAAYDPAFLVQENDANAVFATDNHRYQPENVLIISDCRHAEIFVVKRVYVGNHIQKIEPKAPLKGVFDKNAEIALFEINKLYIKKLPHNGLYLEDIQKSVKPLQEGVNSLTFKPYYQNDTLRGVAFTVNYHLEKIKKVWFGYAKAV